jgi:hypothetical protein
VDRWGRYPVLLETLGLGPDSDPVRGKGLALGQDPGADTSRDHDDKPMEEEMNEGTALVGNLCRFSTSAHRLTRYGYGICTSHGEHGSYQCDGGYWYDNAEAIEVTVIEVKPEPPDHEAVMTEWWKAENGIWEKVQRFWPNREYPYLLVGPGWESAEWFTNREHAKVPPE